MGAVFRDGERLRHRQIKHLAGDLGLRHFWHQRRAASAAAIREMIDGFIGLAGLAQGFAFVAAWAARFFP